MVEQLTPQSEQETKVSPRKRITERVKHAFIPALKTEVETPTPEQSAWADAVLANVFGKIFDPEATVGVNGQPYRIEYSRADTRKETERRYDDPYFINITGAWGRGPETESEIKTLACAMGEAGLSIDAVSLPGHGASDNIPKGWNTEGDFDFAADFIAAHIAQIQEDNFEAQRKAGIAEKDFKKRKIIVNAWSMGGVTALKIAATYPNLIDGVILIDTPVFPQSFKKLALRFITYEAQKLRSVRMEPPMQLETELPGLGIILKRIKERNKGGIPFKVLLDSARSLAKQNLADDGTLDMLRGQGIPVLQLRGSNDYLISHEQTDRLEKELQQREVDVETKTIPATGHCLTVEQPVRAGNVIKEWLQRHNLV